MHAKVINCESYLEYKRVTKLRTFLTELELFFKVLEIKKALQDGIQRTHAWAAVTPKWLSGRLNPAGGTLESHRQTGEWC